MPISKKERLELLQKMSRNWLELRRAISELPFETMLRPETIGTWSVKEVVAHIAAWDRISIERIEAAERGQPVPRFSSEEVDALNRESAEESADFDLADVLDELDEVHQELMDLIETSDAVSPDIIRPTTYGHYAEHAAELRTLANKRRSADQKTHPSPDPQAGTPGRGAGGSVREGGKPE